MIGTYARRTARRRLSLGADAEAARGVLPRDPRALGRPGRHRRPRAEHGRRSGVPRLVGDLPAHGREPRGRGGADADERARSTSGTSCRRSACRRWCCIAPAIAACCVEEGRYVASLIPGARFVELPGDDHLPFVGDQDAMLDEIERFLAQRARARRIEPRCWRRSCASTRGGDRPAGRAIACRRWSPPRQRVTAARAGAADGDRALRRVRRPGPRDPLRLRHRRGGPAPAPAASRIGLHTGECDLRRGTSASGPVAAVGRAGRRAGGRPARCWCRAPSSTWSAGSGLQFSDRGMHQLWTGRRGWRVFAVRARPDPDAGLSLTVS